MRATVNDSAPNEGGRKIYVGVHNMHVKAVNPNLAQLQALGFKSETKEPDYFIPEDKEKKQAAGYILRFILENKFREDTIKTSISFFLRKEYMESTKNGVKKFNYIDQFGNTTFLTESDHETKNVSQDWIHKDSLKKVVRGEIELIDFLRNLFNPDRSEPTYFENGDIKKLFAGDVSGVRKLVSDASAKGNAVRVLFLPKERDGKLVQSIFNRKFDRAWSSSSKYIHKAFNEQRSYLNGVYTNLIGETYSERDFIMREVDPLTLPPLTGAGYGASAPAYAGSAPAAGASTHQSMNAAPSMDALLGADDDLPF